MLIGILYVWIHGVKAQADSLDTYAHLDVKPPVKKGLSIDSANNFILVNLFVSVDYLKPSFYFEHVFRKLKLGIGVPYTIGQKFSQKSIARSHGYLNKYDGAIFITGLDLNYYLGRESFTCGIGKFFMGTSFEYIAFKYFDLDEGNYKKGKQKAILMRAGVLLRPGKRLGYTVAVGIGGKKIFAPGAYAKYIDHTRLTGTVSINVGYRF